MTYRVAVRTKSGSKALFDVGNTLDLETTRAAVLAGVEDAAVILILTNRPVLDIEKLSA